MNNYVIISGSTQQKSQSSRLSTVIKSLIDTIDIESHIALIDLAEIKHQEWNKEFWGDEIPCPEWKKTSAILAKSDAIIFVVPEWHGMIPPALMNLLILSERNELSHKPALIVSVSAGNGGAYTVAQLKGFYSKNNRLCFIPDHVIIRNIRDKEFDGDKNSAEDYERLTYSLSILKAYIPGLAHVRQCGVLDYDTWPYGM
ncbi:NAD(P)H-dependent oxidoreductase [Pectobacterium polonicum]|uniref:NAD(P)H-dependent oxidoreductase n=1 Tax=Pectobacterium polonicum TaxID=2485124 RepID=A0AAE9NM06_9GAMM|nr:NAD(P)H-dependent oxidoreductase [Pectobacterium polonicum]MDC9821100.1 NAD(P)H-dependent oxidoreductase [Pectobacterium polonicum]UVO07515.1 NAD(P)H-dependent oxidoreductase [Pectobacterium polonicum]GKW26206.1 FMN reductase [Pectobacterium carotovorum subsp. carotovorum]